MSNQSKARLIYLLGMLVCVVPSICYIAEYFPIWKKAHPSVMASGILVSGFSIAIIACVALPPLTKWVKCKVTGHTPSAWFGFSIVAIMLYVIKAVIDSLVIVFAIAALSNLLGVFLFKLSDRVANIKDEDEEMTDG